LSRRIIALIIAVTLCFFMTGCDEKDGSDFIFKYDIPLNPRTLDPQTATGQTAALLISNLYDGLLQVDSGGSIIANIATEYFISDDGLTYTFFLRDDIYWYYDGDFSVACTARDFVFAFRRMFNPAVKSENARLFYSIKNSEKVHKGEIPYLDAIGVEAVNDHELIFTLEYPYPLFPYLLTTSPAMPCNEELFEKTAGRYGLNEAQIPSNGAFYISRWSYDPYSANNNIIIMRRNSKNSQADRIYPLGLNFFIGETDPLVHFLSGNVHSIIAEGESAVALMSRSYPYDSFENSVWGITFNTSGVFQNPDLRFALATGFDREHINVDRNGWRSAFDVVPPLINHGNTPYRIAVGEAKSLNYEPVKAREAYEKGAKAEGYENLTGLSVIIPENREISIGTAFEILSRISQDWQATLGFFCTIKALPEDEFAKALNNGDFDIAMVKLTGDYNSPDAYLSLFGGSIASIPYPASEYNDILVQARHSTDMEESAALYRQAEDMLLSHAVFVPVSYQTEQFFYGKRIEGLVFNPFSRAICYRNAKYF